MSNVRQDDERPGDPAVDQAWRTVATDEPSAQLDATILAAAQAATVRKRPASTPPAARHWWINWQPLAAAAGVAGLAFTIVQMLPREAAVPTKPSASTEQAIERSLPERSESMPSQNAAPVPAPPPAPPPAPREAAAEHPTATKGAVPAAPTAPSLASEGVARDLAGATTEADASSEQRLRQVAPPAAAQVTPQDWARRIEALYGAGDETAAANALQAFRSAYPDADQYLAEALLPWAASVGEHPAQAKEPAGITP
ncbi:MAG: hypothetical protein QG601_2440 [Pseudomonadota bacterium]|nr:hypothetical protein [Pseudomonadota bacterium]MDQ1342196.1 hypothetical protein [Pseudomonadota bacterium]